MSFLKVSSLAIAATLFAGSAFAADLIVADPVVDMASPKASEFYVGVLGSAGSDGNPFGGLGVVIGGDVDLTDVVFLGAEVRGEAYWGNAGYTGSEIAVRALLGVHATDSVDLYVAGGVGAFVDNTNVTSNFYEVAVGAEFDVMDNMALRAEVAANGNWGAGFTSAQANLGLLWKL